MVGNLCPRPIFIAFSGDCYWLLVCSGVLVCSGISTNRSFSVACFSVRVSVMFHLMFVHYTFSSVWVTESPPFGK